MKEELTKERDEQLTEIVKLREQMAESEAEQSKLEEAHEDAKQKIQEVRDLEYFSFEIGGLLAVSANKKVAIFDLILCWRSFRRDMESIGQLPPLVFSNTCKLQNLYGTAKLYWYL